MAIDEDHDDGLGGRSRTRREITEGNRWGRALMELDPAQFAAAPLPDEVRAEAELARRSRSFTARDRAIRRVDALMRDLTEELVAEIDGFLERPPSLEGHPETLAWLGRLERDGDGAVEEMVATWPDLDVQRLRALVRNLRRPSSAARARSGLRSLLDELVQRT